jgi:hypothetical protein
MKSSIHFLLLGVDDSNIVVNTATGEGTTIAANISIALGAALSARTVTVDGASGSATFTVLPVGVGPVILSINPTAAPTGTKVTLTGLRFGNSMGRSMVNFDNLSTNVSYQAQVLSWSDTAIEAIVPTLATIGSYEVKVISIPSGSGPVTAQESNPANFQVTALSGGSATMYPNPFNAGKETIHISVADTMGATNIGFYIFDMTARLVYKQVVPVAIANYIDWDGRDMSSMLVGDGAYLVRIINEDSKTLLAKGKLLVVKR